MTVLRNWLDERRRKQAVVDHAVEEFRRTRETLPMGAHVLRLDQDKAIVRVMYMTNHIPLGRAWFAVPASGAAIRELAFEDVASIESPWR